MAMYRGKPRMKKDSDPYREAYASHERIKIDREPIEDQPSHDQEILQGGEPLKRMDKVEKFKRHKKMKKRMSILPYKDEPGAMSDRLVKVQAIADRLQEEESRRDSGR